MKYKLRITKLKSKNNNEFGVPDGESVIGYANKLTKDQSLVMKLDNGKYFTTSTVVNVDEITFETLNSIYNYSILNE